MLSEKVCTAKNTYRVRDMVFNATFNHISVISWQSVVMFFRSRHDHDRMVDEFITTVKPVLRGQSWDK
jgi:hypothetical protein